MSNKEKRERSRAFKTVKTSGGWLRTAAPLLATLFFLPTTATAYVGPGAGLSMIGSAIALLVVVLVAMAGLIIWPIRVMQRRKRQKPEGSTEE